MGTVSFAVRTNMHVIDSVVEVGPQIRWAGLEGRPQRAFATMKLLRVSTSGWSRACRSQFPIFSQMHAIVLAMVHQQGGSPELALDQCR